MVISVNLINTSFHLLNFIKKKKNYTCSRCTNVELKILDLGFKLI